VLTIVNCHHNHSDNCGLDDNDDNDYTVIIKSWALKGPALRAGGKKGPPVRNNSTTMASKVALDDLQLISTSLILVTVTADSVWQKNNPSWKLQVNF